MGLTVAANAQLDRSIAQASAEHERASRLEIFCQELKDKVRLALARS
jgi:hypothetical protein